MGVAFARSELGEISVAARACDVPRCILVYCAREVLKRPQFSERKVVFRKVRVGILRPEPREEDAAEIDGDWMGGSNGQGD